MSKPCSYNVIKPPSPSRPSQAKLQRSLAICLRPATDREIRPELLRLAETDRGKMSGAVLGPLATVIIACQYF